MAADVSQLEALFKALPQIEDALKQRILSEGCTWDSDIIDLPRGQESLLIGDLQAFAAAVAEGFPDLILELVPNSLCTDIERNRIAFEFTFAGTNTGWFRNVGVTNREVKLKGFGIADFQDNQGNLISKLTTSWNCTRAMAQLGVRAHMRPDPVPLSPVPQS